MIKTKNISDFKIGQNIYGFFQVTLKEKNISKNGDYYIDLFLRDRTGMINGKVWDFISKKEHPSQIVVGYWFAKFEYQTWPQSSTRQSLTSKPC